ncbi:response regulator [Terrabacter sp. RAF57]|uniref:response regulator n=1 Tax=Terrabacter sp. RAF57 TaxID=3233063 RepID=UPI003F9AB01A
MLAVEDDIEVVAQAADGVEAVHQAEEFLPDVIVMDVGMPKRGGIEACRIIKQRVPSVLILMLTGSDDDADLFEAIRAGADGYLLKSVIEDIAAGIRGVANGESQLSPAMATKLLLEFKQISTSPPAQPRTPALELRPSLTDREVDVLQRRARPTQPGDRRRAEHYREHRPEPHPQHPRQAADAHAHGGGHVCRAPAAHRSRRRLKS